MIFLNILPYIFILHPTYDNKYNNEGELFENLKSLDLYNLKR